MAAITLTVRVSPCRHYIVVSQIVGPGVVAFKAPEVCPTCGAVVTDFFKIVRADTHEQELVLSDDDY